MRADFIVLDPDHPALAGGDFATIIDRYVISGGKSAVRDVFAGGIHVVQHGHHVRREPIARRFLETIRHLTET
jgi:formimidoylglutamate deiminase